MRSRRSGAEQFPTIERSLVATEINGKFCAGQEISEDRS
jgi:hypothetical protein